jgi:hypothetical protein
MRIICRLLSALLLFAGIKSASAFSLLGPFEPWMTTNLGFIYNFEGGIDIGGPMNIGEGYRWNVPVIAYGYDQSFLDYFGTNGVAAVESAIQIFNGLPAASTTNLNGYLLNARRANYHAADLNLYDLKSSALGLIVEQLGLASPTRFIYVMTNYTDMFSFTVIIRNFDPVTLAPSVYVNGVLYDGFPRVRDQAAISENFPVDEAQLGQSYDAVADYTFGLYNIGLNPGLLYTGLTRDDVGGLSYLYGTNNFAVESLIPGVRGAGRDARHYVNRVLRPGVGKITFQRLDYDERRHRFIPITLRYMDSYLTNNTLQHQTLEREIKKPDILFTAQDLGFYPYSRSGTSNWVNNGAPLQDGPGVIQPPVAINFGRLGPIIEHIDSAYSGPEDFGPSTNSWASFDTTTNAPIVYPAVTGKNTTTKLYVWSFGNPYASTVQPTTLLTTSTLSGPRNKALLLQTSTNLSDWFTITAVTNVGWEVNYLDWTFPNIPQRFFRVVSQ